MKKLTHILFKALCFSLCFIITLSFSGCLRGNNLSSLVSSSEVSSVEDSASEKTISNNSSQQESNDVSTESSVPQDENIFTGVANEYGNTTGNLQNVGFAAFQDGWTYFSTFTGLYKCNSQNMTPILLHEGEAFNINVSGQWIYFIYKCVCYRIKIDGSGLEPLFGNVASITLVKDWIYYTDSTNFYLYKIKTDMTGKTLLISQKILSNLDIVDNKIYCGNNIDVYVFDTNGKPLNFYEDAGSQNLIIYKGKKYTSGGVVCSNIDGSEMVILHNSGLNITIQDDWVYFINTNDEDRVYKIKIDGTGLKKLNDQCTMSLNIAGEWIYYTTYEENDLGGYTANGYRRVHINGTDDHPLT